MTPQQLLLTVKLVILAVLVAWGSVATWAWNREVHAFAEFKAEVKAAGEQAEKEAKATEAKHNQVLVEVSHAWSDQLPKIRSGAVAAYLRRHPERVPDAGGCQVRGAADSAQGPDGTGEERVAARCEPDEGFIRDAAEDASKVRLCREWIERIGFPVEP